MSLHTALISGMSKHRAAHKQTEHGKSSEVKEMTIKKMDGGYMTTEHKEGGDYPGKQKIHTSHHKMLAHVKSCMCPSDQGGSIGEEKDETKD